MRGGAARREQQLPMTRAYFQILKPRIFQDDPNVSLLRDPIVCGRSLADVTL
jgi:hypothetical protein